MPPQAGLGTPPSLPPSLPCRRQHRHRYGTAKLQRIDCPPAQPEPEEYTYQPLLSTTTTTTTVPGPRSICAGGSCGAVRCKFQPAPSQTTTVATVIVDAVQAHKLAPGHALPLAPSAAIQDPPALNTSLSLTMAGNLRLRLGYTGKRCCTNCQWDSDLPGR